MPDRNIKKWALPNSSQRLCIMGHTGCGKTQQGMFALSEASIESRPWIVVDYKGDELINQIPYRKEITYNDRPTKPGIYIIHPRPDEGEAMEDFLWRVWERGNTGLYVDEAYNMPDKGAYQALLIQGRSKKIPVISLTQKPSWVPSQVFSESDHFSVFHLSDRRDHRRINEFMPVDLEREIPEYHSWWYRVKDRAKFLLRPVPAASTLLDKFARRLAPKRRLL